MSNYLISAAIDFGTTYSGYAFSTVSDFKNDPLRIHAHQAWNAGGRQLLSLKTPTCILLNWDTKIVSFGYDAENAYAELVLEDKHHEYYFFSRFKMSLLKCKGLIGKMRLEDVSGKSMLAIEVFGLSIKALKDHLLKLMNDRGTGVDPHEIRWVLTVPAIWPDNAKQFMRKSAQMAGIEDKNLLIALEPEAASIHCQYLPTEKLNGASEGFKIAGIGQKYMVIDLGGGTADITVHEKLSDGHLKELCHASGGDCGGTSIDNAFIQMIVKILGDPLLNLVKKEDPSAYLDLLREFETVKRKIETNTTGKVNLTIPCATINALCEKHQNKTLISMIQSSPLASTVALRGDKMRIDADVMKSLFDQTIRNIVFLIKDVLTNPTAKDVPLFLLVGGFAECPLVQSAIKTEFSNKRIIIPEEAGLSVLKGAVLFGHKPDYIASRVMRYSYGTLANRIFDPAIHNPKRKYVSFGKEYCYGTFDPIIKQNESVAIGTRVKNTFITAEPYQNEMTIKVYAATQENPMYVDDECCTMIGQATVAIPFPSEEKRSVNFVFTFGNTEISMTTEDATYGTTCESSFKLI